MDTSIGRPRLHKCERRIASGSLRTFSRPTLSKNRLDVKQSHNRSSWKIQSASSDAQIPDASEPSNEILEEEVDYDPTGDILGPTSPQNQPAWRKGYNLAQRTAKLVWANAWPILVLFAVCDGVIFILHRFCHRLTNAVALKFLLPQNTSPAALGGNLWYLSNNPDIANFQTGYQWVVGLVFLVMFPISILFRTFASASSQAILAQELGENKKHPELFPPVKTVASQIKAALKDITPRITKLWQVDLLVAVRSIPLQGLSLLILPLPWTIPCLLNLQLAGPIALFQGEEGDEAIKSSARLIKPVRKAVAFPYIGLLVGSKLLAFMGRIVLVSLSSRITMEIPEIPIAIYGIVAVLTLVINRVQDLLPFIVFTELKSESEADLEASNVAAENS